MWLSTIGTTTSPLGDACLLLPAPSLVAKVTHRPASKPLTSRRDAGLDVHPEPAVTLRRRQKDVGLLALERCAPSHAEVEAVDEQSDHRLGLHECKLLARAVAGACAHHNGHPMRRRSRLSPCFSSAASAGPAGSETQDRVTHCFRCCRGVAAELSRTDAERHELRRDVLHLDCRALDPAVGEKLHWTVKGAFNRRMHRHQHRGRQPSMTEMALTPQRWHFPQTGESDCGEGTAPHAPLTFAALCMLNTGISMTAPFGMKKPPAVDRRQRTEERAAEPGRQEEPSLEPERTRMSTCAVLHPPSEGREPRRREDFLGSRAHWE